MRKLHVMKDGVCHKEVSSCLQDKLRAAQFSMWIKPVFAVGCAWRRYTCARCNSGEEFVVFELLAARGAADLSYLRKISFLVSGYDFWCKN
ncbi:hypothetical protein A2U01_0060191 [Trifolium medium]|uniref:Uncharacterized protein n=1 Tax=Trifolium medium TaxID=97028 RepID=A0A392RRY1_9FABA|nr:hypothetical protein [Trifolium medium]